MCEGRSEDRFEPSQAKGTQNIAHTTISAAKLFPNPELNIANDAIVALRKVHRMATCAELRRGRGLELVCIPECLDPK